MCERAWSRRMVAGSVALSFVVLISADASAYFVHPRNIAVGVTGQLTKIGASAALEVPADDWSIIVECLALVGGLHKNRDASKVGFAAVPGIPLEPFKCRGDENLPQQ
jgi:hypothetical protein